MQAKDWPLKILIIDDDEDDFFITSEYIKSIPDNNFLIDWCYNYKEALQHINNRKYNLYLIDYHLGANTGLDLIKEARGKNSEEPFIILTGKGNQKIDIEAMQAGAVDYLIKSDLDSEKLERCIRYSIERANALKALKANERKFRKIFERSADAVFLANEQLFFNDINDATTKLLEYDKKELFTMNLFSVFASDEGKTILEQELSKSKELDYKEVVLKTKSGALKYCILSLSQEFNNGGVYYQGIIHDITNIKKAERATLHTEKRNVADRLVHVLAHEVRNPLNNINLSLEQLSPELQQTDNKIFLDIISRNSKRIEDLITELLNSSRPAQIEIKEVALHKIAEASIAAALDRVTLKKIKLVRNFPEHDVMIMADGEKLKIAFLNIIINAIEAMKQGESELTVTIKDNKGKKQVSIQDNGCGISDENLSRLFEPFFTAKRNGMGLGLATTLNILQSHKAEVEVHSKINKGTTFIITFPKVD